MQLYKFFGASIPLLLFAFTLNAEPVRNQSYVERMQFSLHESRARITYRGKWIDLLPPEFRLLSTLYLSPTHAISLTAAAGILGLGQNMSGLYERVHKINSRAFTATGAHLLDSNGNEMRLTLFPQPEFRQQISHVTFGGKIFELDPVLSRVSQVLELQYVTPGAELALSQKQFAELGLSPKQVRMALTELNRKYLAEFKEPLVTILYAGFAHYISVWDGSAFQQLGMNATIANARQICESRLVRRAQEDSGT